MLRDRGEPAVLEKVPTEEEAGGPCPSTDCEAKGFKEESPLRRVVTVESRD